MLKVVFDAAVGHIRTVHVQLALQTVQAQLRARLSVYLAILMHSTLNEQTGLLLLQETKQYLSRRTKIPQ